MNYLLRRVTFQLRGLLRDHLIPAFNARMFLTTFHPSIPPHLRDSYSYVTHEYLYELITFCFLSTRCIRTLFPASIVPQSNHPPTKQTRLRANRSIELHTRGLWLSLSLYLIFQSKIALFYVVNFYIIYFKSERETNFPSMLNILLLNLFAFQR